MTAQTVRPDKFVVVRGGLVSNDPGVPVFDMDVLDSDFTHGGDVEEVAMLLHRIQEFAGPTARQIETELSEWLEGTYLQVEKHPAICLCARHYMDERTRDSVYTAPEPVTPGQYVEDPWMVTSNEVECLVCTSSVPGQVPVGNLLIMKEALQEMFLAKFNLALPSNPSWEHEFSTLTFKAVEFLQGERARQAGEV